jgi:cytochrome oxidase Cu insertion factor (SCO1/SenC/PrrC family)
VTRRKSEGMLARSAIALLAVFALALPAAAAAQQRTKPVAVGEQAPDFTLTDQNGRSHSLAAERGKRAVVLVFYRGYW